jgi:hypothetical protein
MRYRCVHCDLRFEIQDEKPRCPRCLRRSGLDRQEGEAVARRERRRSPIWLIVGLVLALFELGGFLNGHLNPPDGIAGAAVIAAWLAWAAVAAAMVVVGLRAVLARMD